VDPSIDFAYIADVKPVLFATLLLVGLATAQSKPIDTSSGTEQKPCALLIFDKELRGALGTADVARIALLVEYPLRVNDEGGSFYIHDAASLHGHFGEIFTPKVRKAIVGHPLEAEQCGAYTVRYRNGEVWVNLYERSYRISSINVATKDAKPMSLVGRVEFACRTDASRIVLDSQPNGSQRLRAWNTGRSLTQSPDLEITGGKKELEGAGPCSHAVWTFESGTTEFVLSEGRACYPDSNEPPADAVGQFTKHTGQKDDSSSWCH
jgi:hypothetical protein